VKVKFSKDYPMENLDKLIMILWMLFGIYMLVLFLILADLWSGVRKARKRGEIRSSFGYRKTVAKLAKYYNVLLALTVVDCMQMGSIWYLDNYYDYNIPVFPLVTLVGAIGIGLIEIKSIYEKAEDKMKLEYQQIGSLVGKIVQSKASPQEIAKAVIEYMNENPVEKEKHEKTGA